MAEQYAGALLYLVPVVVAAIVAFIVTRPEHVTRPEQESTEPSPEPAAPARTAARTPAAADFTRSAPRIPSPRTYQPLNRRASTATPPPPSPTLLHAALSSHLAAVAGAATSSSAPASAKQPLIRPLRLASIRKPARIPRRPIHQCPHKHS